MRSLRFLSRPDTWAIFFLAAWHLFHFWPVATGQQAFAEGDINWLFLPIRTELARALASGRLPLWSPGLQAGFPLFAEGEVAALYPLNLIAYRLFPVLFANSFVTLFSLVWASIGMYLLVRSFRLPIASALFAGFVFGSSGFVTAQISHMPHLAVAAWLPWLLLFQEKYWQANLEQDRNSIVWFLVASGAIALQLLAGFPQIAFFNLIVYTLAGLIAPLLWRRAKAPPSEWFVVLKAGMPKAILMIVGSSILGAGIAAVQLLPTYELVGLSIRGNDLSKLFFTSYSLDPGYLSQFLIPFWKLGIPDAFNMEYWGYIGVLPILLALITPILRRDIRVWFWLILALLALVLALGGNTPLYDWFYYVPVFNRFRVPARFLFLFTFAGAFLAAIGIAEIRNRLAGASGNMWSSRVPSLVVLVLIVGTVYQAYNQPVESWMEAWQLLPAGLLLASLGLILLGLFRRVDSSLWGSAVLALTIVDLAAFSAPFLSNLARMAPPSDMVQVPRTVLAMDNADPNYRVIVDKHPYTSGAIRASLWTNLPLLYDKQGVKSYLPSLAIQRNDRYVQEMSLPMRNLMNIRYYLLPLEVFAGGESLPPPFDESEPYGGLTLGLLAEQPEIPPTRVAHLEVTSYTDQTADLPNGTMAGEILLRLASGESKTLAIRLGYDTADWAFDGLGKIGEVKHGKPSSALRFPAYLKSVGQTFDGHKYVTRYDLANDAVPPTVVGVGVRSLLPGAGLTIERISLIDDAGRTVSLASLLRRQDLALAFRSHTAAMWENLDVLPRAFLVHQTLVTPDNEALAKMQSPDFRPDRVVVLGDAVPMGSLSAPVDAAQERVVITDYEPERVIVQVDAKQAGYLILTDSWYPGWSAKVDGTETPIHRADYIFRAVPLSPGVHTVQFEYHPASLVWGTVISVISIAVCALVALRYVVAWRQ